jgi:copper ion binding protein
MSANTIKETYNVEGMTCSGCERTVQKVVGNVEGVSSSKADLASNTVTVEFDPSKVTPEKLKEAVGRVGYRLVANS